MNYKKRLLCTVIPFLTASFLVGCNKNKQPESSEQKPLEIGDTVKEWKSSKDYEEVPLGAANENSRGEIVKDLGHEDKSSIKYEVIYKAKATYLGSDLLETPYFTEDDAKTLEGVLEACKKGGKDFVMDCGDGFYACTFAFTAGAKIDGLEEDGTQKFTDYNEDDAVKTIMAFAKLMKDYKGTFKSLNVKQVASGFTNGTCGAGVDGSWDTEVNKPALGEKFGAAKLPTINVDGTDKQLVSMFGYKYIGVNGSSKFPATSQILALYLSGEECAKQRVESLGWGTSNKAVQESDLVKGNVALNAIKEQAANACVQVNIAPTFWQPMGTLGNKIVADEWDPSDEAKTRKLLQDTIANVRDEG